MKIEKINSVSRNNTESFKEADNKSEGNKSICNNTELSNVCYKPISFGRKMEEHQSWGARINPKTGEVSFKLFTYPDARRVYAIISSDSKDGGDKIKQRIELENKGKGVFEKTGIPKDTVQNGDKYQYEVTLADGKKEIIKDPYTFKQDEINGPSEIYDQSLYPWQYDTEWKKSPERITRTSNGTDGHKSLREASIYALSPDTITDQRKYDAVISKLKEIKENGFNSVEIMHVENTFSFNWGYDGVDKMAPSTYLGGPDKLKKLVDEAHKEGLNVIFDVIPNHIGPDGNQLERSGPYIKGPNAFGSAINYEGENSEYVRDYMINAMMNWFENYHVDGLRLDMTKYMESDSALKQLAAEINYHYPEGFLIAEDGRGGVSVDDKGNFWDNPNEIHDKRVTNHLLSEEYGGMHNEDVHDEAIRRIIANQGNLSRLGMDSEWDFRFYHETNESLYVPNTDGLVKAALCAQDTVKYTASHDEIGNFEGTRKLAKLMVPKLRLNDDITLNATDIERAREYADSKGKTVDESIQMVKFQKAQFAAETLAMRYQKGELDKYELKPEMTHEESSIVRQKFRDEVLNPIGVSANSRISFRKVKNAFEKSYSQNKMSLAFTFGIPGPKMIFQGDEKADLTPFRFFRRFEFKPYEDYLFTEKGYEPAEPALEESTMGKIKYSKEGLERMEKYNNLTKDLNKINKENKALRLGYIIEKDTVDHPMSQVIGLKSQHENNEIFSITNFGETNYREDKENEYGIVFPKGRWVEILNTDDEKYGGSSRHLNKGQTIHGDGRSNQPINLAGYSTIYFKRVG